MRRILQGDFLLYTHKNSLPILTKKEEPTQAFFDYCEFLHLSGQI